MTDLKHTLKNKADKFKGEATEAVGKVTGNEELELKGKIQSAKADLKKKAADIKEDITEKINDKIDEHEDKKRNKK